MMNNYSDFTVIEDYYEKEEAYEATTTTSLEDWLAHNIPPSPDMMQPHSEGHHYDFCQCCQQSNCEQFEFMLNSLHKFEEDARLAAVLGQNLLQKHEQHVADANTVRTELEHEVDRLRTKVSELQESLLESDTVKQHYLDERNKCMRQLQRLEKAFDNTASELNECNSRCIQLGTELKAKKKQIEKLSVCKLLAKQADIREEALTAKLEDLKQELAYSRKVELTLESKHKKLEAKFESIKIAYKELLAAQKSPLITAGIRKNKASSSGYLKSSDLQSLQKTNEMLRQQILKLTTATTAFLSNHITRNNASDVQNEMLMMYMILGTFADNIVKSHTPHVDNDHLIEMMEELATTNRKLEGELFGCNVVLSYSRNESDSPWQEQILMNKEMSHCLQKHQQCAGCADSSGNSIPIFSSSAPIHSGIQSVHHTELRNKSAECKNDSMLDGRVSDDDHQDSMNLYEKQPQELVPCLSPPQSAAPTAAAAAATTMTQYHYHYYYHSPDEMKFCKLNNQSNMDYRRGAETEEIAVVCQRIHNHVKGILQKIKETEIKALSRQQQRDPQKVFDMVELTRLSNANLNRLLLNDIEPLKKHIDADSTFLPLLLLLQNLLIDMCQLRLNLNDIQLEYVRKVREMDKQFKDDIWRKMRTNGSKHCKQNHKKEEREEEEELDLSRLISDWLTNILSAPTTSHTMSRHGRELIAARSSDYCRLHTRLLTANGILKRHASYTASRSSHDLFNKEQQHYHGRRMPHKRSMPLLVSNDASHLSSSSNCENSRRYPVPELQLDHDKSRVVVKRFKPSASISTPISTTAHHAHGTTTTTTSIIMRRRVLHNHLQYLLIV